MNASRRCLLVLGWALVLAGCGRGNGVPDDLVGHLKDGGITLRVISAHAPAANRAGYVVTADNPATVSSIITHLGLKPLPADDPSLRWCLTQQAVTVGVKAAWGVTGRPVALKLRRGGQFEYFYLVQGTNGQLYLLTEYAYG